MSDHTPTGEQRAILNEYRRQVAIGRAKQPPAGIVIEAYAGSGKTTIIRQMAESDPTIRFLYLAYNRSAKDDAEKSFPINARCYTGHGLARRPMSHMADRMGASKYTPGSRLAKFMGITGPTRLSDDTVLAPGQLASVVRQTIKKFCYSADEKITGWHVPNDLKRFTKDEVVGLRSIVPPIAQRMWDTDITADDGDIPMDFDYYLKAYALTHPRLPGQVIALDEAQDSNPCVAAMVREQTAYGKLIIMTGDTYQSIYEWRGAVNAMADFAKIPGVAVLSLTQSFRFGEEIAAVANQWLGVLGADKPLRGFDKIQSRIGPTSGVAPDAILCRTNAEAFKRAIDMLSKGLRVAFPKSTGELMGLVKGARDIKQGRPSEHPDLMAFQTWGEVQDFVENDPDGSDLKLFVDLVDKYGVDELFDLLSQIGDESKGFKADVVISTAHGAKGREWRQVLVADDFPEPKDGEPIPAPFARLAYVTVTRAMHVLDNSGLSWLDGYLAAAAIAAVPQGAAA